MMLFQIKVGNLQDQADQSNQLAQLNLCIHIGQINLLQAPKEIDRDLFSMTFNQLLREQN